MAYGSVHIFTVLLFVNNKSRTTSCTNTILISHPQVEEIGWGGGDVKGCDGGRVGGRVGEREG